MHLLELMDADLFQEMLERGMISVTPHPRANLEVLNYTAAAQYSRTWNDVTLNCRGLIINGRSDIVARPFPKFFNLAELDDADIPQEPFEVFEKVDGSLGILYPDSSTKTGWAIATRGSFTSDQALHATALLNSKYGDLFFPHENWTYLFEIIYPANRIVVDYHGQDDLVLLDVIDNLTGMSVLDVVAKHGWPGPQVQRFDGITSWMGVLGAPQPDNFEGYVVRFAGGMRVKVKTAEYVRLHRLVTGVSSKTIHEFLSAGRDLDELVDRVPDEFHEWVEKTVAEQRAAYNAVFNAAKTDAARALKLADACGQPKGSKEYRKDFAYHLQGPYKSISFLMYDGKNVRNAIWRLVAPTFEKPFSNDNEGE